MLTEVFTANAPILSSIALFQRDHPSGLSRIHPDHWTLWFVLEGSGVCQSETGSAEFAKGHALLTRPGQLLQAPQAQSEAPWRIAWAFFREGRLSAELHDFPASPAGLHTIHVHESALFFRIENAFLSLVDSMHNRFLPRQLDLAYNRLEEVLIWLDVANAASQISQADSRISRAVQHIKMNYQAKLTVEDLARIAGLGDSRFSHLFRELTGKSPMKYLESVRLAKARELLESSSFNISEISDQCGFSSVYYFSNVFKKHNAIPPSEYRKKEHRLQNLDSYNREMDRLIPDR